MSRMSGRPPMVAREIDGLIAEWMSGRLSRRSVVRRAAALGLSVPALAMLVGRAGPGQAAASVLRAAQDDPASGTKGGNLRVITIGEPPTLDQHQTTAGITAELSYNMMETLFAYDSTYQPMPMLAESHTISADGLTQTIVLRQGVKFHNGDTLTADDVIASLNRWGQISGVGKRVYEATNEVAKVDDHTIEFRLKSPYGTIPVALSNNTQGAVIYPKSVMDRSTLEPITAVTDFIGTGPYKITEWQPDAYIRFARFDDYVGLSGVPNGYTGSKYAYLDTIEFIPVPDEAARVTGLQAGDYDLPAASTIGNDQYETLRDSDGIVAEIMQPTDWDVFFLNWKSPLMGNLAMREAIQASLDHEPMLLNARGGPDFIRLDPGLMMQQTAWYTTAGGDRYNMNKPDIAKTKLQEAGYDGTPVRFMTTQEYPFMYGCAIVAQQQMEAVGIKVDLQVSDWATVVANRAKPEAWDLFTTSHGFVPDPSQISYVGQMNQYPGWWSSEASLALASQLLAEGEFDTRFPIWEQIQGNAYTEIPAIKIGDSSLASFRSERVGGWVNNIERGIPFWNLWLK